MKRVFLASAALFLFSGVVSSSATAEDETERIHRKCLAATDYTGCVSTLESKAKQFDVDEIADKVEKEVWKPKEVERVITYKTVNGIRCISDDLNCIRNAAMNGSLKKSREMARSEIDCDNHSSLKYTDKVYCKGGDVEAAEALMDKRRRELENVGEAILYGAGAAAGAYNSGYNSNNTTHAAQSYTNYTNNYNNQQQIRSIQNEQFRQNSRINQIQNQQNMNNIRQIQQMYNPSQHTPYSY